MRNRLLILVGLIFLSLNSVQCFSGDGKEKKFTHAITQEKKSLFDMMDGSSYTVYYCWADWCGPCLKSMKSTLLTTKAITDSIGIPIKYNTILYSGSINDRSKGLMENAYNNGIEVFFKRSMAPLTQKLAITSDLKAFDGFKGEFKVPRVILVDPEGNLVTDNFGLNYDPKYFMPSLKSQFPQYFED